MKRATPANVESKMVTKSSPFELRRAQQGDSPDPQVHIFGSGKVCDTEGRGFPTPRGRSPLEIVVDASEGFIPLWAPETTLRWRFRERSLRTFKNPNAVKAEVRRLFGEALLAWGTAAPVKFAEKDDLWDFEIVMRRIDNCDANGCVLASAFFPDAGRHALVIYPKMLTQSRREQVETLVHEIGHVFGLRHFFAQIGEQAWPSEIFGTHQPFSVMNYGSESVLTPEDKADLRRLYQSVWRGVLTQINGTPVRLIRPFHAVSAPADNIVAVAPVQPVPRQTSYIARL